MSKNKITGLLLAFSSLIFLFLFLLIQYIAVSVLPPDIINGVINISLAKKILRSIQIGLMLLSPLTLFLGIPFGIYFLRKKEGDNTAQFGGFSQNSVLDQEKFIFGWSWGAFFGTFIWALGNKLYGWAFCMFIPLFNIYVWLKLSISGRRMAWAKGWNNFEQFKERQKLMGWIILILGILVFVLRLFGNYTAVKSI